MHLRDSAYKPPCPHANGFLAVAIASIAFRISASSYTRPLMLISWIRAKSL